MANLGCDPHHVNVLKKGSVPTIFSAKQFGTPADILRQLRAESPGAGPTTTHRPTTPSPSSICPYVFSCKIIVKNDFFCLSPFGT